VGCYILYSEEGTGRGRSPPRPLPRCIKCDSLYPSTASVPITVFLSDDPLHCVFNVPIKGLMYNTSDATHIKLHPRSTAGCCHLANLTTGSWSLEPSLWSLRNTDVFVYVLRIGAHKFDDHCLCVSTLFMCHPVYRAVFFTEFDDHV